MHKRGTYAKIQVQLPVGLDRALEEHCAARGVNKSQAIRLAIHEYLDAHARSPETASARSALVETVAKLEGAVETTGSALEKIAEVARILRAGKR